MFRETIEESLYWELPGPREFLSEIDSVLRTGGGLQQLLVAVPVRGAPPDLAKKLGELMSPRQVIPVTLSPDCPDNTSAVCLSAAGIALPEHVPGVGDLVNGPLAGRRLVIDASRARTGHWHELAQLIQATAALAHNARSADLPLQIVAIVPGHAIAELDETPRLAVRWWWGRLGRLDSALALRSLATPPDPVLAAAISEIAAFDLALALCLARTWDGDLDSLRTLLFRYAGDDADLFAAPQSLDRAPHNRPAASVLAAWSAGACDLWDHSTVTWHPSAVAKHDPSRLQRSLWRAQAATVLPQLEEQRERVVAWLDGQGHTSALGSSRREASNEVVEIGEVWHYMRQNMRSRPQFRLVEWLRNARNDVAHLRCLTAAQREEGRELIQGTQL